MFDVFLSALEIYISTLISVYIGGSIIKAVIKDGSALIWTICSPIIVGFFYWDQLPDKMATHFDMEGTPNGWSSKWFAIIGIPVVLAVVNVLCTILTETDPRRHKYPEKMMKLVYWICPVVSWICAGLTISYELGVEFAAMPKFASLLMGIMFIVIGNYLPKVKQNYYMGIKLPWTYSDEENWNRTHRMAGKLWVVGGIVLLLNFFLEIFIIGKTAEATAVKRLKPNIISTCRHSKIAKATGIFIVPII